MNYVLDKPPLRPTPALLSDDYAKWDESTNRYWLKLKLPQNRIPGKCATVGCDNSTTRGRGEKCGACRKYISILNRPVLRPLQSMRCQARHSKLPFEVDAEALENLLQKRKVWDDFMKDPHAFVFRRKDTSKGFTVDNLRIERPDLSWV